MKALWRLAVAAALIAAPCSCKGVGSSNAGVTFAPENGATDQAVDAAVSATFTKAISEVQWSTVFTLRESGTTANLCTSYTYDAAVPKVTCAHDALKNGTSYTLEVLPSIGVSGGTGTFTTVAAPAQVVKRAIPAAEGEGPRYEVVFSFDPPLAENFAPIVTLERPDAPLEEVAECVFDDERAQLACTIACPAAEGEPLACSVALEGEGFVGTSLAVSEIEDEAAEGGNP